MPSRTSRQTDIVIDIDNGAATSAFDRGAALTAVLVVATLTHALVLTLLVTTWIDAFTQGQPVAVFVPLSIAGAAVTLVAYAGIWTGHRWAFWLLAVMAVVAVAAKVAIGAPDSIMLLQFALQILLGAAVLRRWSGFS